MGVKDGRGYGPHGRGYYVYRKGAVGPKTDAQGNQYVGHLEPDVYAPFGPNCERLEPSFEWDAQVQARLGFGDFDAPAADDYTKQRNTYNLLMAGLLGVSGVLLVWAFYPKKR